MFDLDKKTVLVTGASQGIGKSIAIEMANQGSTVICISRKIEAVQLVSNEIKNNNGMSDAYACDIIDGLAFTDLVKLVLEKYGKIDALINNAGVTNDSLLMRMTDEQWNQVIDVNLKGAFNCSKAVLRPMLKQRSGRIINITSIVGLTGNAGQSNYAASKAGIIGLTKSLSKEVGSRGITVNCIAPGWIKTNMTDKLSENVKNDFLSKIPLARIGLPSDIASAAIFLASDNAGYITGQTITVDGGRIIN